MKRDAKRVRRRNAPREGNPWQSSCPHDRASFVLARCLWIATAEDILFYKLHWNRLSPSDRQPGDAAGVYAVQSGSLDADYLQQWTASLGLQREYDAPIAVKIRPKTT